MSEMSPHAPQNPVESTPSLIGALISWRPSLPTSWTTPRVSAAFESQVKSFEDKLNLREVFPISFTGHSPFYVRYCRIVRSDTPILASEQLGSIALLAQARLNEMLRSSHSEVEKRRICRALGYDDGRTEEHLKVRVEKGEPQGAGVASVQESPLSDASINRRIHEAETLRRIQRQELLFHSDYPNEASYFRYGVSLKLDASQRHYQVALDYNTQVASTVRSFNRDFRFAEPFSQRSLEEKLCGLCGPLNSEMLAGAA